MEYVMTRWLKVASAALAGFALFGGVGFGIAQLFPSARRDGCETWTVYPYEDWGLFGPGALGALVLGWLTARAARRGTARPPSS